MMELGVGCMLDSSTLERQDRMGFCDYMTLKRSLPSDVKYDRVTLRNLIYSLVGSAKFSYKQSLSISKIYDEYVDKIDYNVYDKYVIEHKNALLVGVDINTSLKLLGIMEYMFSLLPEYPDDIDEKFTYLPMDIDYMDVVTFKYSIFSKCYGLDLDDSGSGTEFSRLQNKLLITVFKKVNKVTNPNEMYINAINQIIRGNDIEIFKYTIFGLLAYNGVVDNGAFGSDYQFFYRKDGNNHGVADMLIKKYKPIKLEDINLPYKNILREAVIDVFRVLETDTEVIENTIQTFYYTIGGYIPVSSDSLKCILRSFQQMNNLASVYNLSVEFLSSIDNKKNILRNCLLSASCFFDDEDTIIAEAYSMYFKYALLDYLHKNHLDDIMSNLTALKSTYNSLVELNSMKSELEELRLKVVSLSKDNEKLSKELANKDDKKIHRDYYELIKNISNSNEKLEKELEKEKAKNKELTLKLNGNTEDNTTTNEINGSVKDSINLKDYKILFIGHPEAYNTVKSLGKHLKDVIFIDAENVNQTISKEQLAGVDFTCLQYQFIGHTSLKYKDMTDKHGIPLIRVKGTNKDSWLKQIAESIELYVK